MKMPIEGKADGNQRLSSVFEHRFRPQWRFYTADVAVYIALNLTSAMRELSIGINSWIIQDGNYGDFAVGDTAKFALEFAGERLVSSAMDERSAKLLHRSVYRIRAEVVFVHPTVWVIDFGVRAYWESVPPKFVVVGSWVEGEIFLGIDPFFYSEHLRKLPEMPNLYYEWNVTGISRDDTPWLSEVNERGGVTLSRDATRVKWSNVDETLAWDDDDGRSDYVLQCCVDA